MTVTSSFMWTKSGQRVDLECLDPDTILLEDIACHLGHIRRWAGAVDLTVAEHSLNLLWLATELDRTPAERLRALLHDASEYLLGDMARPILRLPIMAR